MIKAATVLPAAVSFAFFLLVRLAKQYVLEVTFSN